MSKEKTNTKTDKPTGKEQKKTTRRSRRKKSAKRKVTGTLQINSKGFGFVRLENEPDLFIHFENLSNAMDGDNVEAEILKAGEKPYGKITGIVSRSGRNIIGVYRKTGKGGKVYPEDNRLPSSLVIPPEEIEKAGLGKKLKNGQIVLATLLDWSDSASKPKGSIKEIVGDQNEPGIDLKIVALSRGFPLTIPEKIVKEAESIPSPNIKEESKKRKDLRNTPCFTIDPETAKDFDDAVSLKQLPSGLFELGVHIADVSHFVPENSPIDREAWERATSVYLVHKVLPMLPERLSNEICSLVPGEPRLAFSIIMKVSSLGEVKDFSIEETIIKSKHRFTYEEVEEVIEGKDHKYATNIHLMQVLSQVLRLRREEEGSIDFDLSEPIIDLDEDGVPREIKPKQRLEAHRLIEEFMLLANRTVAGYIVAEEKKRKGKIPFIYRNHETPPVEDAKTFLSAVENLGIPYKPGDSIEPEDYRNIIEMIQNFEFKDFVEKIALKSMTKAVYDTENKGHFGLAFPAYTHFTSPIRRYPDLVVHRLLKRYLSRSTTKSRGTGKGPGKGAVPASPKLKPFLQKTCKQSTEKEITAVDAEREYIKIKSMEFLAKKVGRVYEGLISGVTSFGLFVELSRYLIEGLVPLKEIKDDFYTFDEENFQYVGKESGKVYRLGDRVRVKIERVSVEDRKADFSFVDESEDRD